MTFKIGVTEEKKKEKEKVESQTSESHVRYGFVGAASRAHLFIHLAALSQ